MKWLKNMDIDGITIFIVIVAILGISALIWSVYSRDVLVQNITDNCEKTNKVMIDPRANKLVYIYDCEEYFNE